MDHAQLETVIDQAFDNRDQVNAETKGEVREAVERHWLYWIVAACVWPCRWAIISGR